jgi:hypothetical protein
MQNLRSLITGNRVMSRILNFASSIRSVVGKYNNVSDYKKLQKATSYIERFREIVSDPLNMLIERVPHAGYLDGNGNVFLHNGVSVPIKGPGSYYQDFSEIFIINRGVHEPLEEYCFQTLLSYLSSRDETHSMLELGAYWGHYSLWFSKVLSSVSCTLVEPELANLEAGKANFIRNQAEGRFIQDIVGKEGFGVDQYLLAAESTGSPLTLLHSDIQGYEVEMLVGAEQSLRKGMVEFVMVSTHGDELHRECERLISDYGFIVEVSSEPILHTTSTDGFIFARRRDLPPIVTFPNILGRVDILHSSADELREYVMSAER